MEKTTDDKIKEFANGVIGLIVLVGIGYWFFGGSSENSVIPKKEEQHREVASVAPVIPKLHFNQAIQTIKSYDLVKDAAVVQEGYTLSLIVIVSPAMNEKTAKEMGDNFVRQVMVNAGDLEKMPSKKIGQSNYDYMIAVVRPDESEVVSGTKPRLAESIRW
jgi:hypothetical protein